MTPTCPTCGSEVRVHSGSEGTNSYIPAVSREAVEGEIEWLREAMGHACTAQEERDEEGDGYAFGLHDGWAQAYWIAADRLTRLLTDERSPK